jgi:hypothetical protein
VLNTIWEYDESIFILDKEFAGLTAWFGFRKGNLKAYVVLMDRDEEVKGVIPMQLVEASDGVTIYSLKQGAPFNSVMFMRDGVLHLQDIGTLRRVKP